MKCTLCTLWNVMYIFVTNGISFHLLFKQFALCHVLPLKSLNCLYSCSHFCVIWGCLHQPLEQTAFPRPPLEQEIVYPFATPRVSWGPITRITMEELVSTTETRAQSKPTESKPNLKLNLHLMRPPGHVHIKIWEVPMDETTKFTTSC